ncbi:pentapeptide repeat-containing protein [Rossellomorea aquimaris]|uniref:pentapeptide repeat-containing protein n=1 Tax=Rossellomorea aquimaris TaxID=189382 RepID=UPI001CD42525|nr:pentapeptide repeat-containing protein [Rossellomorea aquimaris]MCA1057572.1 pentapeptide repeat-containing protein [Rossellomorea aquimaris]
MEFGTIIGIIAKASLPVIKGKVERNLAVISVLKRLKLSPEHPPKDFSGVYAYTLVEYGIGKHKIFLDFFSDEYVKDIFKKSFEEQNPSSFLKEINEFLDWHELGKDFKKIDIDPKREVAKFSVVFESIINMSRNPSEIMFDHDIKNLQTSLENIINKLDKLDSLEKILEVLPSRPTEVVNGNMLEFYIEASSNINIKDFERELSESEINFGENLNVNRFSSEYDSVPFIERSDVYIQILNEKQNHKTYLEQLDFAISLNKQCFIYLNQNLYTEGEFKRYLESANISVKRFEGVNNLTELISKDIKEWLLVYYREMTALLLNQQNDEDHTKIKKEATRIRSTTDFNMVEGTNIDLLFYNVKNWFKAIGYTFEKHKERSEEYVETIINIPGRRRGRFDRVLIRCIDGEIDLQHCNSLSDRVNELKVHEGWLITNRRISIAAQRVVAETNIECYTFDELIDEDANFDGYLEWLENLIKDKQIHELYIPLACTKEEYDLSLDKSIGVSRYGEEEGYIEGYIDRWLDDPTKKHISILGEFGTGKTWFSLHYAWTILLKYKEAKAKGLARPRIPLFIPLRDYAKAFSVETLLSDFFFRRHEIDLPNYAAFEELNRMGKLLLIFDGFDEMAAKVDRQQMINNFWELAKVVGAGAKALLTCRTEHFPEAREGRDLLNAELKASTSNLSGEPPQFEVLNLEKFTNEQINTLLLNKFDEETVKRVLTNKELMSLIARPVMSEFIMDALPDIKEGKPIDISRVYLYAIKTKMERDIKSERTFTSLADKLYFLSELSFEMLLTDEMSVNYRDFPKQLKRLFGTKVSKQKDLDHWHYDMLGQTILIRNSEGDYSPFHRSLTEFFTAYKFASHLGTLESDFTDLARSQSNVDYTQAAKDYNWTEYFFRNSPSYPEGNEQKVLLRNFNRDNTENLIETFGSKPITMAIIDLLINMVSKEKLESTLFEIIEENRGKSFSEIKYLISNSLVLLKEIRNEDLSGLDFSNCILVNCNLERANLTGCNFKNSDLSSSNLQDAILKNATLEGANLEETLVKIGWVSAIRVKSYEVNIKYPFIDKDVQYLKENQVYIECIREDKLIWETTLDTVYMVDMIYLGDFVEVSCIEGEKYLIELETGNIQTEGFYSNLLTWENVNIDLTIGLSEKNRGLLMSKGALSMKSINYQDLFSTK